MLKIFRASDARCPPISKCASFVLSRYMKSPSMVATESNFHWPLNTTFSYLESSPMMRWASLLYSISISAYTGRQACRTRHELSSTAKIFFRVFPIPALFFQALHLSQKIQGPLSILRFRLLLKAKGLSKCVDHKWP